MKDLDIEACGSLRRLLIGERTALTVTAWSLARNGVRSGLVPILLMV